MRNKITYIFFCFMALGLKAQTEKSKALDYRHLVIKQDHVLTQELIDLSNDQAKKDSLAMKDATWKDLDGNAMPDMPGPPLPPPMLPQNSKPSVEKTAVHFLVMPEYYVQFRVFDEFEEDSLATQGFANLSKIDRDSLTQTKFRYFNFEQEKDRIDTRDTAYYEILSIDKNDTKTILGFKCFKVVLQYAPINKIMEMYVADGIKLNYHPVFLDRKLLEDFFPLYIKEYERGFENKEYTEYKFYEYR